MKWGIGFIAPLIACGTIAASDDGGDADADATTDACTMSFACADVWGTEAAPLPPPVPCPATAPTVGDPCTLPDYQDCEYGTKSYFCNEHFVCWSGQWLKNTSIPSIFCGTDEACASIVDGGACQAASQVCPNGDAGICVCGACGVGPPPEGANQFWRCFSPGTGCALDRPNVGTTCDLPDGSLCSYTRGGCCTGVYEGCTNGVWVGQETEPCP